MSHFIASEKDSIVLHKRDAALGQKSYHNSTYTLKNKKDLFDVFAELREFAFAEQLEKKKFENEIGDHNTS